MTDAQAAAEVGTFAVAIEKTTEPLARDITRQIEPPTIGIGHLRGYDGRVLVVDDMIGLFTADRPKFVHHYAEVAQTVEAAISAYCRNRRSGSVSRRLTVHYGDNGPSTVVIYVSGAAQVMVG